MDRLRTPLFVLALILIAFAVLIEIGSAAVLQSPGGQLSPADVSRVDVNLNFGDVDLNQIERSDQPGLAIQYLALVDSIVLFTVGLMGISLLVLERIHGRIQGIATLIFAFLLLLLSITLIFVALGLVMLMVSLFLAVPFGTITYLAVYGFFDRGGGQRDTIFPHDAQARFCRLLGAGTSALSPRYRPDPACAYIAVGKCDC